MIFLYYYSIILAFTNSKLTVHYSKFYFQIKSHLIMGDSQDIIRCYGITKKSETDNFIMVMEYMNNGSLRQHLNNNFNSLDWTSKLQHLHLHLVLKVFI